MEKEIGLHHVDHEDLSGNHQLYGIEVH